MQHTEEQRKWNQAYDRGEIYVFIHMKRLYGL